MEAHGSSFRDTAGFVFTWKGAIYRQINQAGQVDYELMKSSGLYKDLIDKGLMVAHKEVSASGLNPDPKRYKIIKPEVIPFISYPYEWSFAQLRDAALLTLRIQQIALRHGMILKDASAYNVQFIGKKPIFIDTLSFAKYEEGRGWEGYKQFCEHFLGPLALTHFASPDVIRLLATYLDGIPLELTVSLLPAKARLKKGLLSHLYIHKSAQRRHQGTGDQAASKPVRRVSKFALQGLHASLESSVRALKLPAKKTEWDEYYSFSNYTDKAFQNKRRALEKLLAEISPKPKMVWDLGANNGAFSSVAAEAGAYTIAWDIDPKAVNANYLNRKKPETDQLMLPLVQDIAIPSPAIGWGLTERHSLLERGPADVILALALIHHLAIGRNVPLAQVAELLARVGKHVIIEFVPKDDSKVQHLLASRKDIFDDYTIEHFEAAMKKHFPHVKKKQIGGSKRWLYLYSR
jgi:predicted nicotinamide N-methyase